MGAEHGPLAKNVDGFHDVISVVQFSFNHDFDSAIHDEEDVFALLSHGEQVLVCVQELLLR